MDKLAFMKLAIKEAKKAELIDEVPIGAVIVKDGKVIARAHNKKESKNQATRHAEIEAIEKATKKVNNWWLEDCDIYVTLEPCAMCAGALINSRLRNIYFGAYDKKAGCCGSLYNLPEDTRFNHRLKVEGGILEEECASLLTNYFKKKRK
jgi:tRNA(adenine34) deaminase